ncbi:hypothetical protein V1264_014757 [Littorina saxatilis]|uniref:GH18 domain-containing protein n=1 Tax=Littorina saxatilis TaxID=31220 RepID=A0AAN9BT12_9CAEN
MEADLTRGTMLVALLSCLLYGGLVSTQDVSTTAASGHDLRRVVCYMAGWAHYRPDPVQFHPEDLDTSLCTHVIFAFVSLDKTGVNLVQADPSMDAELYQRLAGLKREKPKLKVMLAVGGYNMGSEEFTVTVSSITNMHAFAMNAIEYLHRYNFDGLDVDWEFPGQRGSPPGDKHNFTQLLQILHSEFHRDHHRTNRTKLLLSVAINPSPYMIGISYELPEVADTVDFINAMTYDLHGNWEAKTGHHSPLYSSSGDPTDSIDFMIQWILNTTVPPEKLNLGLAFYGHSFNLTDPSSRGVGAPSNGPGKGGELLAQPGSMAYYEVCKLLTESSDMITESGRLGGTQAPYVVDGHRWTGYDDVQSITEKVKYAMDHGLGGVFIWTIDMDDFHGICGGGHYPLMNAVKQQVHHPLVG